jgi:hypothetical protein
MRIAPRATRPVALRCVRSGICGQSQLNLRPDRRSLPNAGAAPDLPFTSTSARSGRRERSLPCRRCMTMIEELQVALPDTGQHAVLIVAENGAALAVAVRAARGPGSASPLAIAELARATRSAASRFHSVPQLHRVGPRPPGASGARYAGAACRLAVAAPTCQVPAGCQLECPMATLRAAGFASSDTGMVTCRMPLS